jgi:hypothetical protein
MPGQPVGEGVVIPGFEKEWEKAERRIQSIHEAPSREPREGSVNPVETDQEIARPGAFRAIHPAASARAPTPPDDTCEMQEPETAASLSVPIMEAHVVSEDQVSELESLKYAVISLQQQQSQIMEARIVHASEVIMEDNDNDAPSFLKMYGTAILMTCLAFVFGILVGSRT